MHDVTKNKPRKFPRQKYVSKICGNLGSIKKQPKCVKSWNVLTIKGL